MAKKATTPGELIDQRIEALDDWRGEALAKVRALIKQAEPAVIEEWLWKGIPVWSKDGIICTGEHYKAAVKLTFPKGAKLKDPKKLFNSSLEGSVRRALDIHEGDKLNATAFKALIKEAVALNAKSAEKKPVKARKEPYDWNMTEERLIVDLDEDLKDAWIKLRSFCKELGPQRIYASAQSINFARKTTYMYVRPKKKALELFIFLPRQIKGLQAEKSAAKKPRYSNIYKLTHADLVDEPLTDWIREAFDNSPAES